MPDSLPDVPAEILEGIGDAVEGVTPSEPATPAATADPINPTEPASPAAPEGAGTEEAATAVADSFTKLDPSTLPPEVRPYYESMQSDYTRKTQAAAPWRKLSEELGVDSPDAIRDAVEVYTRLQDPNALREFVSEANRLLGLEQPAAPAAAASPAAQGDFDLGLEDPDLQAALAPIMGEVSQLREELARRDAAAQQEQMQWALLGEINRQEAMLKEAHPNWGEEEWDALWNTSVAFNGDLMAAAQHIEAVQNAGITRLLNSKHEATHVEGLTPPTPAAVQTPPTVDEDDPELRGATQAAKEFLRNLVNQSE